MSSGIDLRALRKDLKMNDLVSNPRQGTRLTCGSMSFTVRSIGKVYGGDVRLTCQTFLTET